MLTPYPYQKVGADFLADKARGYLADGMGLGKTVQAVLAAQQVNAQRSLVICPASVVPGWEKAWGDWNGPGAVDVVSYSSLHRAGRKYDLVIADEAHYMKTPSAQRTRAGFKLARAAERAWLLSGTPMPNHPGELWAPVKHLWPELAASLGIHTGASWLDRFCMTRDTQYGPKPYAVRNGPVLRELLKHFMIRRKLEDVALDLPPLRVDVQRIPASAEQKKALAGGAPEESEYTSTLRRILGERKAGPIAEIIIEELQDHAYGSIVVLYYHRAVGLMLQSLFATAGVTTTGFHGGTPSGERQKAIESFQNGEAQVFLAQQTAAGVGITLTRATELVLVEPAWSPDDNDQAIKRIHRIGQEHPCRARIFAFADTLDDAIMGTLAQKMRMQKEVGL